MSIHYSFPKGKRIYIIFKDGRVEVDKWRKSEGKYYYFERLGEVRISKVRSVGINRWKSDAQKREVVHERA